ncbi:MULTISPECIES: oxidoreductase [unclassified Hahella]|uniref:oxidoreductase n=1 Tax=unclassified Hahella TaxID=2624107 RepID=UPI001C1EF494|nr:MULTISPECIES: oxidoreductase [unclassified Hahella]MBU6953291.1 oxidoreductase [Hahella sp. HN01]MDG9670928.1 oxidoreductase [Hahella sp. CR1]
MEEKEFYRELFKGLRAVAESAFPKRCNTCGRVYETAEQFLSETENIRNTRSGLKESEDDDGSMIVEVFRNCACGSTLMDVFNNRRDLSEAGLRRRKRFGDFLEFLVEQGIDRELARDELLKVARGMRSHVLEKIRPPKI